MNFSGHKAIPCSCAQFPQTVCSHQSIFISSLKSLPRFAIAVKKTFLFNIVKEYLGLSHMFNNVKGGLLKIRSTWRRFKCEHIFPLHIPFYTKNIFTIVPTAKKSYIKSVVYELNYSPCTRVTEAGISVVTTEFWHIDMTLRIHIVSCNSPHLHIFEPQCQFRLY